MLYYLTHLMAEAVLNVSLSAYEQSTRYTRMACSVLRISGLARKVALHIIEASCGV